jgi:hypothetical protein
MAPKFFKKEPRAGRPLSLKGLAAGISRLAFAVENMDCAGGYIDWTHGRPMIIPPGSSGDVSQYIKLREATADATYNATTPSWETTAEMVNADGTLDASTSETF